MKNRKRNIPVMEIGADMMAALLGLFIVMFAFMSPQKQQELKDQLQQESVDTIELPTNEVSADPLENAVIVRITGNHFEVRYKGNTQTVQSTTAMLSMVNNTGFPDKAKVVLLAEPATSLGQVINYLEQLQEAAHWTTPEIGILNY